MKVLDHIHEGIVYGRRVRVLADSIAEWIPPHARVLDVGCGDGLVSKLIQLKRPDVAIEGIDVLLRPRTHIPVTHFDGERIPHPDRTFDVVLFVDVLHHTTDPTVLLREAVRVARSYVFIKDHTRDGVLAGSTLRFMDWVGNARHGVALPCNYWPEQRWRAAFREMELDVTHWTGKLPLYPWWAAWLFGRSLHCFVRLATRKTKPTLADCAESNACRGKTVSGTFFNTFSPPGTSGQRPKKR